MSFISKEVQIIAGAFRQALESEPNPGNSVNATDNPHQVALIGRFSIYKAAERVWAQLRAHFEAEEAAIKKSVADALAAEKAKATDDFKVIENKVGGAGTALVSEPTKL